MRKIIFLIFGILLSCTRDPIQVYTEYITIEDLASYQVDTPDPFLERPNQGQRFVIFWSIPKHQWGYQTLTIAIRIRFGNLEEVEDQIQIGPEEGTYTYSLINEDYFQKKGIHSYKVQFYGDGQLLDERKHQLWVELIQF